MKEIKAIFAYLFSVDKWYLNMNLLKFVKNILVYTQNKSWNKMFLAYHVTTKIVVIPIQF